MNSRAISLFFFACLCRCLSFAGSTRDAGPSSNNAPFENMRGALAALKAARTPDEAHRITNGLSAVPVDGHDDLMALYDAAKREEDALPMFAKDQEYNAYVEQAGALTTRLKSCSDPRFADDIANLLEKEYRSLRPNSILPIPKVTQHGFMKDILGMDRLQALMEAARDGKNEKARPVLWKFIDVDKDGPVEHWAAAALGGMGKPEDLDRLMVMLKKEPNLRITLSDFGSMVIPRVLKEVEDPSVSGPVKSRLAGELRSIGSHDNISLLVPLLRHQNSDVANAALDAITGSLQESDESLIHELLKSSSPSTRASVIIAIGTQAWSNRYVPLLVDELKNDAHADNRAWAAHYLGVHKVTSAVPVLNEALKDPVPHVRDDVAYALEQIEGGRK